MKLSSGQPRQRQPRFLWQGMLIVLPVAVLAVVSLASLHRDELTAERTARERAAQNVQSLARTVGSTVKEELQRFLSLQSEWLSELRSAGLPDIDHSDRSAGVPFPSDDLKLEITRWEQTYRGLKLADLFASQGKLLTNGTQLEPAEYPVIPVPPKWYRELTIKQRDLWESLRRAKAGDRKTWQLAFEAFVSSDVSEDAKQAAFVLQQPAEGLVARNNSFQTESGITFQDIACLQLLQVDDGSFSNGLLKGVWLQTIEKPSFVAPILLSMAEALTNRADAVARDQIHWMRVRWNVESKARTWITPLRQYSHSQFALKQSHWTKGESDDEALAVVKAEFSGNNLENKPSVTGYTVTFVPRIVVAAIFARALAENRFLIPDFATLRVTILDKPLWPRVGEIPPGEDMLLGSVGYYVGVEKVFFGLKFYMTSREQMLSSEHQRIRFFGALIIGTALTALIGLVAAWRAFLRQRQLNEMKSNFVSSVSHELRAPIASMRLMAENLERGKVQEPPRQKEYFSFIVQECRRLSSLIENILDFSRIEQGRKQYEFEPTNMVALTEQTMKLMEHGAADKDVRLELETRNIEHRTSNIQHPMPDAGELRAGIELNVDGKAMQQALVNLIDNAIKHSPKGSMVQIGLKLDSASFQLWVADAGEGIPSGEHEKIFERFYRRGSELRRETQGVGIGLSIVKHIVEAHGGRVLVASEVGKGSRFTIEIPVRNEK